MSMLTIEVDNREVRRALEQLSRRGQDMSPVMRAIGADMERRMLERFETKTDPTGRKWAPLKPATLAAKKGRGSILYRSGALQESRSSQADARSVRWGFGQKSTPRTRGSTHADGRAAASGRPTGNGTATAENVRARFPAPRRSLMLL
jgi:phage virion morphogenesis protein